ncbi:response regulator [Paenibacillus arenilitoris]|uniref:Response regulator n=1 Tax=Paenibacillus arenilitoris TaxID=2772299 RepID=A0A927H5B0_9BACL|nr:response regulator [Paenibacillus arenilitoris]MBD2868760.1 response regulator [Paenibacillus arenilitoris]
MLQLLIVDDEPVILHSMVANDWASAGIGNVYQASSGLEAAELMKNTPIDIVVSDIRMPGMDGLQLCKHIQDRYPRAKCILLSGYGEFEYAQKAILYGTVSYLLKPIKDEELMAEVARVRSLILEEWERIGSVERARQSFRAHLPLLKANLLNELLSGADVPAAELTGKLGEYGLPFEPDADCSLMLLRLEDGFGESPEDAMLYEFAVRNVACEILEADYGVWTCKDAFGYLCILLQDRAGGDGVRRTNDKRLDKAAHELQLKVSGFLKGGVSVLIGGTGVFPRELADRYRKALSEFRKVPRSDRGAIVLPAEPRAQSRSPGALYSPPGFQQLLEAGRWADARAKLGGVFEEMRAKKLDTEEHMTEIVYTLMNAFYYIAHLQGKTLLELSGWEPDMAADPRHLTQPEKVREWADKALAGMEAGSVREIKDGKSQLISKIHRFIEAGIAGDVSLQTIADHVGLHPVYLSSVYKQETRENISDFIMRYRMETAGVLLRTTDVKIYELASRLGFQNPPYFSKLFKQYYGITPQEFRDRHVD